MQAQHHYPRVAAGLVAAEISKANIEGDEGTGFRDTNPKERGILDAGEVFIQYGVDIMAGVSKKRRC